LQYVVVECFIGLLFYYILKSTNGSCRFVAGHFTFLCPKLSHFSVTWSVHLPIATCMFVQTARYT